jgi:UDP-N-acetylglucosamine--N-acetylmuramyl-(pentapeptide) pyrophosphoryl-undecaprenol N-acetylglucosamine transferase
MTRILFVGGGSGGHVMPLIAVWQELQKMQPKCEALFVCSERPEDSEYLRAAGIEPRTLPSPKASLALPFTLLQSYRRAQKLLDDYAPDAVLSKGGSLSVAVCIAAKRRGIPVVLHESDAVMGRANKLISRTADVVCLGLSTAKKEGAWIVTGNPVRSEITKGTLADGKRLTGLPGKKPVLLIYGGSQGAATLNEWAVENLNELLSVAEVIHLTGKGKKGASARAGYFTAEFAQDSLPHLYAMADLALCRAGGGTIGELAACGVPAVLVPLRGLAQDHQELNARAAEKSGGCLVMEQTEIQGKLASLLHVTLEDKALLKTMSTKIRTLHHPEATSAIAALVLQAAQKNLPTQAKRR